MTIPEYMLQEFLHNSFKKKKNWLTPLRKEDLASYLQVY